MAQCGMVPGGGGGGNMGTITVAARQHGEPSLARLQGLGGLAIICPSCGLVTASGMLLCGRCGAVYYFSVGNGRAISPIACRMYQLAVEVIQDLEAPAPSPCCGGRSYRGTRS